MERSEGEQRHVHNAPHALDEINLERRWYRLHWLRRHEVMTTILILAIGATAGATLRYYMTIWAAARFGTAFPYGTLIINVLGSFILGCFLTLATERLAISPQMRLLIATGFCGSFTTFSTFSYETVGLLNDGNYLASALNAFGSLALGLTSVILGAALARALAP